MCWQKSEITRLIKERLEISAGTRRRSADIPEVKNLYRECMIQRRLRMTLNTRLTEMIGMSTQSSRRRWRSPLGASLQHSVHSTAGISPGV